MTVTITKNTPSPDDDTLTRHAENTPPFVRITNEDQIRRFSDGSHVEGAFGNIKNHHTGNVHRGFMCFTGLPLVTLTMTAAVIAYNLRELETWFERASEGDTANPLLAIYATHPLHQRTRWQHGFTMLTAEQAGDLDQRWTAKINNQGDDELDPAA